MLGIDPPVSAYLVQPDLNRRKQRNWGGFASEFVEIRRHNPIVVQRTVVGVLMICATAIGVGTFSTPSSPNHAQAASYQTGTSGALVSKLAAQTATTATPLAAGPASLVTAVHASILPSGPTGEPLPPGTMAPDRTYANNYARGQCTWYVAGRRQIPAGWGNANAWYYHAVSAGWSVGTVPAVAAVAWTSAGAFGHVALVEAVSSDAKSVYVSEMNYRGVGVKSFRWAPASSFKYIY